MVTHLLLKRYKLLQDSFFGDLGDAELHDLLSWDLDRFTRCWVAAHACLAIELHELTKAWKNEFAILFDLGVSDFDELFHQGNNVFLLKIGLGRQFLHELRLCHFHI